MTDTVIEKKYPPKWVEERLNSLGGFNKYSQPNFRVVWGGNRMYQVGGVFKKPVEIETGSMIIGERKRTIVLDVPEMRTLHKYHTSRWHLERWRDPSFYGSREQWYEQTWDEESKLHVLGDYPAEGDYEHVFFLGICRHMKPNDAGWCIYCKASMGEYIPLEENVHILEKIVRDLIDSDGVSRTDERLALFEREADRRQRYRKIVGERVENAMRPKLVTNPSTLMDEHGRCAVPDARDAKVALGERPKLGFRQVTLKE